MRKPVDDRPIVTCSVCGYLGYVHDQRWSVRHRLRTICETCHAGGAHFADSRKPAESARPLLVRRKSA